MFVKHIIKTLHVSVTIVCPSSVHNQTSHRYVHQARTHRQHTVTYQINNLTTQTSREIVTALSTKDGPLKTVKQL